MNRKHARVARLLSGRNAPSILEKEAVLERVLDQVAPRPRWLRWRPWLAVLAPAAVVCVVMLMPHGDIEQPTNEWEARGGGASASLSLRCTDAEARHPLPCRPGSLLTFVVAAPQAQPYFAAFARRPDGTLLWYLPSPDARTPAVSTQARPLSQAVPLREDHPPGRYVVRGIFCDEPLTRAELAERLGPALLGRAGLTVVTRTLDIAGSP